MALGAVGSGGHGGELHPLPKVPRWPILAEGWLDGDGRLDMALSRREPQEAYWFQRRQDGPWIRHTIRRSEDLQSALGAATLDIDGDGPLKWYECRGAANEAASWIGHDLLGMPVNHGHRLQVADINQDGHLDIFCAETAQWGKSGNNHIFKVVDMNRDGELDVAIAEMEQSPRKRVGVDWNLGKSLAWRLQIVGTAGTHNIRVADFNGDGYPD